MHAVINIRALADITEKKIKLQNCKSSQRKTVIKTVQPESLELTN